MHVELRRYRAEDLPGMAAVWNEIVEEGAAFPQEEPLTAETAGPFFAGQTDTVVAADADTGAVLGLYILHPNNVGRCGHICNASYAVARGSRGRRIGERLVRDSMERGRAHGFRILQFNAVVASNSLARQLYQWLGFVQLGVIPGGFRGKDGRYEDICPYYYLL